MVKKVVEQRAESRVGLQIGLLSSQLSALSPCFECSEHCGLKKRGQA